jgi:hypothetical protein
MRMLCTVTIPVTTGNRAVADGSVGKIIGHFLETWKPEGAYFGVNAEGARTGYFVVDVKDPAHMPPMFEPLFLQLDAKITFTPVMSAADLQAGLAALAK